MDDVSRLVEQMRREDRILEGIVTTINADGTLNVAPMGPIVNEPPTTLLFRPFNTSTTYQNLKRHGQGVFHVTDNVLLLAQAAIGRLTTVPETRACAEVEGRILVDACRWHAFRVRAFDDREQRATIVADVVAGGAQRDFFGFNRAKHACLEAAILATRVGIVADDQITSEFARLQSWVDKTGAAQERQAFQLLADFVAERLAQQPR